MAEAHPDGDAEPVAAAELVAEDELEAAALMVWVSVTGGGMVRVTVGEVEPVDSSDRVLDGVPLRVDARVPVARAEAVAPLAEALWDTQLAVALTVELSDTELQGESVGLADALREALVLAVSERDPEGDPEIRGERLGVGPPVMEADSDGERLCVGEVVKLRVAAGDAVSEREPVLQADEVKDLEARALAVELALAEREIVGEPEAEAERQDVADTEGEPEWEGHTVADLAPDSEMEGAVDTEPVREEEVLPVADGHKVDLTLKVGRGDADREWVLEPEREGVAELQREAVLRAEEVLLRLPV